MAASAPLHRHVAIVAAWLTVGGFAPVVLGACVATTVPNPEDNGEGGGDAVAGGCGPGTIACGKRCVDLRFDPEHCGECGASCAEGEVCSDGECGFVCGPGTMRCGDRCVDPAIDPKNCGGCNVSCFGVPGAAPTCEQATCAFTCLEGYGNCNGSEADGCETDLRTSTESCGSCGNACQAANGSAECVDGLCAVSSCDPGFGDCDLDPSNGCETNTDSDGTHCGTCGHPCDSNAQCQAGQCVPNCPPAGGSTIAGPAKLYGHCWYLSQGGVSCDTACADLGGQNLAPDLANAWPDRCNGPQMDDVSYWFFTNGNPGSWSGTGSSTGYHTLGYGYQGGNYYGKCASGTSKGNGSFPNDSNDDNTRHVVCPCFVE